MAPRIRPDVRLVIGIVLVAASVAGMVGIVAALDRRSPVYAAAEQLLPGDIVHADDLLERMVTLDGAETAYLGVGQVPADGIVIARPVAAGELLPVAALGSADGLRATAMVLPLDGPVSATIGPGSLVDVWASGIGASGIGASGVGASGVGASGVGASGSTGPGETVLPPLVLVADATVVRVVEADGPVGAGVVEVEVLVPRSRIARVLQAIADGSTLALVPAGLPVAG